MDTRAQQARRVVPLILCIGGILGLLLASYLLSLHWSSAGLVSVPPDDVITCDSVISVVVYGEHEFATVGDGVGLVPADPALADRCADGSLAPAVAGIATGAGGLTAVLAGGILLARGRNPTRRGEPISIAAR